jgi:hypothetical protein
MVVAHWGGSHHAFCLSQRPGADDPVQLPTFGVAIDANGVLSVKTFADPTDQLTAQRIAAARSQFAAKLQSPSECRKVSLVRLEAAMHRQFEEGSRRPQPPPPAPRL